MALTLDPDIFKAYDVRGTYPEQIHEDGARAIGAAFVAYLKAKRIAVGRDMRLSSPALAQAFIDGATSQGADVVDYGMCPTDMLYFAVATDGLEGGVQITASHNPKQYNGMKMVRRDALPLSGDEGISDIRDMIASGTIPAPAATRGTVTHKDVLAPYVDHVMGFIDPSIIKPFNVVLDAGSGMGGLVAPKLFERLPCKTTRLCFEIDGSFPNHEANPLIEENRRDIVERVIAEKADIGIAWDGDADRCFFIDGTGEFVSGDFVTALLAEAFLLKHPGSTIIYDLRASYAVSDTVARARRHVADEPGRPRLFQEADARDQRHLRRRGDGPLLLPRQLLRRQRLHPGAADARADVEAAARACTNCSSRCVSRYFISGEINTKLQSMDAVPAKLEAIAAKYADAHQYTLDGLSVEYHDWHFNVRPSNTEPLLRLNLEATTPELMAAKRDEVLALIRA